MGCEVHSTYVYVSIFGQTFVKWIEKNSTHNSQQNAFFINDLQGPSKIHLKELENNESIMNHSSCFLTAKKQLGYLSFVFISKLDFHTRIVLCKET